MLRCGPSKLGERERTDNVFDLASADDGAGATLNERDHAAGSSPRSAKLPRLPAAQDLVEPVFANEQTLHR